MEPPPWSPERSAWAAAIAPWLGAQPERRLHEVGERDDAVLGAQRHEVRGRALQLACVLDQHHAVGSLGHGLCVLPTFMAQQDARLEQVLAGTVSLVRSFWLIVHSDLRELARVRITSDFIVDTVRSARHMFLPQ